MDVRLQSINNDHILEITEMVTQKQHYSENDLLRNKTYFEELLAKATTGIAEVNNLLSQIENEKAKQR